MSIFLETFTYILNGWSLNRRCAYFYQNSPCCGMCRRQIKNQKIKNHISSCLDHKSNNEQRIIIVCLPGSWYVFFARIYPLFDFHPKTSKQANNSAKPYQRLGIMWYQSEEITWFPLVMLKFKKVFCHFS